ncbi:hypothetical protein Q4601_04690 [Shewanella sp. 1_MG-2023]|uniref:hypothetical protein n=1 Tax=unclassified Shewanella TaxID=196818 RepID=UPI0026E3804F|nr:MULTISPECIES: hypothetical protein [unclassified Shewanella]MDO6611515.1 hypothetical protein [Shewanella sp. 7_MG-2023]MDO6771370.1 hypothetical protein [Shewanella sp. 2_MG-2023]MDO6793596.1 hypothetical protein [Shewanella sp. 1_MG-2023]
MKLPILIYFCVILSGCTITDYQSNLSKTTNCINDFSQVSYKNINVDSTLKDEIGSKDSQCINNHDGKMYISGYKVKTSEKFISIIVHPNLGPSKSTFFLPQLLALDENNNPSIVKELFVIKGSQIMHGSMYEYFYDVSREKTNNFVITTDISLMGKLFDYEHLSSYDNHTIIYSKIPYAAGSDIEVKLLSNLPF